jgi:Tol biopolymer transport system component
MNALRVAAVALVVVAVAGSAGAGATPRGDAPLLAFGMQGLLGVCATDLQGHTFRLADPRQSGAPLSWSPDGSQLAFASDASSVSFVDADGRNQGTLHWSPGDGEHYATSITGFAWSPDSRAIAVAVTTGYHYGGYRSELVVNQGRSRTVYTGGIIGGPSWSPDGSRIAFSEWTTRKAYVIDVKGSNVRVVLDLATQPVWSPDGKRLAYVLLDEGRQSVGLAVAAADGSSSRKLTDGNIRSPAWSPDGTTIAFTRSLGTTSEIGVLKPDGTGERTVVREAGGPVWSPDGNAIAYAFMRQEARMGVGVISPDGTNERIVETGLPGASLSSPAWRQPAPLPTHRRPCVVTGTPGADVLRGKSRGDVIFGGAGDDRIYGAGGNDVLLGGSGPDRLFGGPGNDVFKAKDAKRDYLFGGPGRDRGSYDLYRDKTKSVERYDPD